MKILVTNHGLLQRSAQRRWRALAEAYPSIEVVLLLPATHHSTDFGEGVTWQCEDETTENFKIIICKKLQLRSLEFYKGIVAILRDEKPDIIYCMNTEFSSIVAQFALVARWACSKAKVGFYCVNNIEIRPTLIITRVLWFINKNFTHFCGTHSREMEFVLRRAGYRRDVLVETNVGVDETTFYPCSESRHSIRNQIGTSFFWVGYCGRLEEHKNVRELLEAVWHARSETSVELAVLVIGGGPLREEIESYCEEKRIRLHITGRLSLEAVGKWMNALDLLVLPSKTTLGFCEPFGLTLVQAMACRVPVVASSSGTKPQVVGEGGMVYPSGFPTALATIIGILSRQDGLRELIAEKGYDRAMREFSGPALAQSCVHWMTQVTQSTL